MSDAPRYDAEGALSPGEWSQVGDGGHVEAISGVVVFGPFGMKPMTVQKEGRGMRVDPASERHALAAMALHNQPFGFTWNDVDVLRAIAEETPLGSQYEAALSLADRIAALLPPRT